MVRVQYVGTLFEFAYETYLTYSYGTVSRPGATGGIPGPFPPSNHCLCPLPPKQELYPPSEDCAPKKVTGSVSLECSSMLEAPKILVITPEFVSKNCFLRRFYNKDPFFRPSPRSLRKFRALSELQTFFLSLPRNLWNLGLKNFVFWSTFSNSK